MILHAIILSKILHKNNIFKKETKFLNDNINWT